jgi:hypothetical protein
MHEVIIEPCEAKYCTILFFKLRKGKEKSRQLGERPPNRSLYISQDSFSSFIYLYIYIYIYICVCVMVLTFTTFGQFLDRKFLVDIMVKNALLVI